jgi:serine/threonine protein kinase
MVGTPLYVAPEIIRGERYGCPADVFSFAITLLVFSLKGTDVHEWLRKSFVRSRRKNGGEEKFEDVSENRVMHNMVNKAWRPDDLAAELNADGYAPRCVLLPCRSIHSTILTPP